MSTKIDYIAPSYYNCDPVCEDCGMASCPELIKAVAENNPYHIGPVCVNGKFIGFPAKWIKGFVCNQCFEHNSGGCEPRCPSCGAIMTNSNAKGENADGTN